MKKLKFAFAGLGRIGKIHLDNLLQMNNVRVVAVMDPFEESQEYAKDIGITNVTSTHTLISIHLICRCNPRDVVLHST